MIGHGKFLLKRFTMIMLISGIPCFMFPVWAENTEVDLSRNWTAVHDFSLSESLKTMGLNGWWIAEKMENELASTGRCRMVTRAKISKVMKEKNIDSSAILNPSAFGRVIGAEYIVTGQIELNGCRLTAVVTLIDAKKQSGAVLRSFNASVEGDTPAEASAQFSTLIRLLGQRMVMTPGEFLDEGLAAMNKKNYEDAETFFHCLNQLVPAKRFGELTRQADIQRTINSSRIMVSEEPCGLTPGANFDRALKQLEKGNETAAGNAFMLLEKSLPFSLESFSEGIRIERERQRKELDALYKKGEKAYKLAAQSSESRVPSLCDEAIVTLRLYLSKAGGAISDREQKHVRLLIEDMEKRRMSLFAGPVEKREWTVPEMGLKMRPVESGKYMVNSGQTTLHIAVTRSFWIGECEIKASEFMEFLKETGTWTKERRNHVEEGILYDDNRCPFSKENTLKPGFTGEEPASGIPWRSAREFCRWLTQREKKAKRLPAGYEYRLPTEAEWEYACLTGDGTKNSAGTRIEWDAVAVYNGNSNGKPFKVRSRKANGRGLYDMHGNLWEWCNDWYGERLASRVNDPVGPEDSEDSWKVLKGGSFASGPDNLQAGERAGFNWKRSKGNIGFRVVCAPHL